MRITSVSGDSITTDAGPFESAVRKGKVKVRTLKSVVFSEPGKIAVDFDSSFSKLKVATETVFLKLEKDGKWHVSSYSIN